MKDKLKKNFDEFNKPKMIIIALAVVAIFVVIFTFFINYLNRNKVNISNYIKVSYIGANHYASAECMVDSDKLYKAIAGNERDMDKLTKYKDLIESISVQSKQENLSNGDNVEISVSYDSQKAEAAGIVINNTETKVKVSGISEGTKISLFENVEVVLAGMSPEAYIKVTNKWVDGYLSTLEFVPDKNNSIAIGDVIHITCSASAEELGKHGYVASQLSIDYTVDKLNSYANIENVDKNVLNNISNEAKETIRSQVDDTTFRMMYKATQDVAYLKDYNDESVSNIELLNTYFLKRKNRQEGTTDNYIYMIYKADIVSSSTQMTVYFAFEYSQGYVSPNQSFDIMKDKPEQRYTCNINLETLYNNIIKSKEDLYQITTMQ